MFPSTGCYTWQKSEGFSYFLLQGTTKPNCTVCRFEEQKVSSIYRVQGSTENSSREGFRFLLFFAQLKQLYSSHSGEVSEGGSPPSDKLISCFQFSVFAGPSFIHGVTGKCLVVFCFWHMFRVSCEFHHKNLCFISDPICSLPSLTGPYSFYSTMLSWCDF